MPPIRLLLVDDQVLFVNSLKSVLESKDKDIQVVGVAYDGKAAVEQVDREEPDIVLMDIMMPVMDGIEATARIHAAHPAVKIIVLTTFNEDELVFRAQEKGAAGYLLKDMLPEELLYAVKMSAAHDMVISPSVASLRGRQPAAAGKPAWIGALTDRETAILKLIAKGYDNDEIAAELFLGRQTVRNYVSSVYGKMGVKDRIHAMRICLELRIFE